MKMVKKKLKFKFLVVCLMFVLSFGVFSFNTFAFSVNPSNIDDFSYVGIAVESLGNQYEFEYNEENYIISFYFDSDIEGDFIYLSVDTTEEIFTIYNEDYTYNQDYDFGDTFSINSFNEDMNTNYEYFNVDELIGFEINDDLFINLITENSSFLDSMFDVFINFGSYIIFLISSLIVVFYVEGQLTTLGILALCGLAISIILLILNIIQNFLHFRG